ncbi:MAG TPA: hypothetical protein VFT74_03795, partial [Isosphaeraceae bacterium]|nr:hypothetical protein [Isosphaeraceae bacterium]
GQFYIQSSSNGQLAVRSVGVAGQVATNAIPVALDYDNDGKADPSIYQPSTSQWSFLYSGSGSSTRTLGTAGALPLGAPLSPYRLPTSSSLVSTASVGALTNFEAAPSTASASAPSTTSTTPVAQPQTASIGTSRMAQIRRLMMLKQAKLQQMQLARHSSGLASNRLVPGGLLSLQSRWRRLGG